MPPYMVSVAPMLHLGFFRSTWAVSSHSSIFLLLLQALPLVVEGGGGVGLALGGEDTEDLGLWVVGHGGPLRHSGYKEASGYKGIHARNV